MHMFTMHVSFYIFAINSCFFSHRFTICIGGGGGGGGSDFILSNICIISERFVDFIYLSCMVIHYPSVTFAVKNHKCPRPVARNTDQVFLVKSFSFVA